MNKELRNLISKGIKEKIYQIRAQICVINSYIQEKKKNKVYVKELNKYRTRL